MRKQRTLWQKIIITMRDIIIVLGVGVLIFEIASMWNNGVAIVLWGACCWLFFKAHDIVDREIYDDKFNSISNDRICVRNALRYQAYPLKSGFRVSLDENFNVSILMRDEFLVKIPADKFRGLDSEGKIEEFDQYLVDHLCKVLEKKLNKSAVETLMEIEVSQHLSNLK